MQQGGINRSYRQREKVYKYWSLLLEDSPPLLGMVTNQEEHPQQGSGIGALKNFRSCSLPFHYRALLIIRHCYDVNLSPYHPQILSKVFYKHIYYLDITIKLMKKVFIQNSIWGKLSWLNFSPSFYLACVIPDTIMRSYLFKKYTLQNLNNYLLTPKATKEK